MTDALVTFLQARLNEEEEVAKAWRIEHTFAARVIRRTLHGYATAQRELDEITRVVGSTQSDVDIVELAKAEEPQENWRRKLMDAAAWYRDHPDYRDPWP